jgi:hypothetical protein
MLTAGDKLSQDKPFVTAFCIVMEAEEQNPRGRNVNLLLCLAFLHSKQHSTHLTFLHKRAF